MVLSKYFEIGPEQRRHLPKKCFRLLSSRCIRMIGLETIFTLIQGHLGKQLNDMRAGSMQLADRSVYQAELIQLNLVAIVTEKLNRDFCIYKTKLTN